MFPENSLRKGVFFSLPVNLLTSIVRAVLAAYRLSRPGGRLKLADFGMATTYGDGIETVGDGQEGDTLYMAKELLSSTERLPSADIFRWGCRFETDSLKHCYARVYACI